MKFIEELILLESEKSSQKEISYVIEVINNNYNEWKKTGRRKNAVDLVTTTANKLSNINPEIIPRIHEAGKLKLASLLVRCMDIPAWKPVASKESIYKKLFPLIKALENYEPRLDSGGTVKQAIATRISAAIAFQSEDKVFVAYEPKIPTSYLRYLFGAEYTKFEKIAKMHLLSLPSDIQSLVAMIEIDRQKAKSRLSNADGKPVVKR